MKFCLLTLDDAKALLQFELTNRAWFEASIEKRADSFYHLDAVKQHIADFLKRYEKQQAYPALIKSSAGAILARTNLRLNNHGFDTFGYRVAKAASGKGVATFATSELLKIAKDQYQLTEVSAFVSVENIASAKVLEKFKFSKVSFHPAMALVKQRKIDCYRYQLKW